MSGKTERIACSGDVALLVFPWTLTGTERGGSATHLEGKAILVLRRQSDGGWLVAVEHPFLT